MYSFTGDTKMKFVTQVYFSWFGSTSLTLVIIDYGSSKQRLKKSIFKKLIKTKLFHNFH